MVEVRITVCWNVKRFVASLFLLTFRVVGKACGSQQKQVPKPNNLTSTGSESKPKKKICCACPDTKKLRDECIVQHAEDACAKWIEAHRLCLRAEGFHV